MRNLRFAVVGAGFWTRYQLSAWREFEGLECVAICNRTRSRAEALADAFHIPAVYDRPEEMLKRERLDFLDIITDVNSHARLVNLAAAHRLPVICQKPMAATFDEARGMVGVCRAARVPFFIHENWRWQTPIRKFAEVLRAGRAGAPFRARLRFCSSFPVFENQPALKELDEFILTDIGSHILDTARFLFGEAASLVCQIHRVNREIKGEDVATVMMKMESGATVVCEMSYASRLRDERFPETYVYVEGETGSIELGPDYWISFTDRDGTYLQRYPPPRYAWGDPAYELVHSSIVPCHANLLQALRGEGSAETTGEDNLRTMQLVFAAYQSARTGQVVAVGASASEAH